MYFHLMPCHQEGVFTSFEPIHGLSCKCMWMQHYRRVCGFNSLLSVKQYDFHAVTWGRSSADSWCLVSGIMIIPVKVWLRDTRNIVGMKKSTKIIINHFELLSLIQFHLIQGVCFWDIFQITCGKWLHTVHFEYDLMFSALEFDDISSVKYSHTTSFALTYFS
jgi:hypothetical protein